MRYRWWRRNELVLLWRGVGKLCLEIINSVGYMNMNIENTEPVPLLTTITKSSSLTSFPVRKLNVLFTKSLSDFSLTAGELPCPINVGGG